MARRGGITGGRAALTGGIAALLLVGCAAQVSPANPVAQYVDEAVTVLESGLYAGTPEWKAAVEQIRPELYRLSTVSDTYRGITELAEIAGGRHTVFFTPEKWVAYTKMSDPGTPFPLPTVSTDAGVSTLTLPSFAGGTQESDDLYQDAGIDALRSAATDTTCGWVIDLRENTGGNAYPMLVSVAPLLDDGRVLGFQDRDGDIDWVGVDNGNLIVPADYEVDAPTVDLSLSQPVAIVTGPGTASAAESIVVAFATQQDTLRIGDYTAGFTTGNEVFELDDGAALALSTSTYVDRTGAVYDGPIAPDAPRGSASDTVVDAASDWIRGRC